MADHRFPYEQSEWHCGESERWLAVLERYGTETVRARLTGAYGGVGSRAVMSVGATMDITKRFAEEWLAWHDRQKADREGSFRRWQLRLTGWAAGAATIAALAGAIGWGWTMLHK